MWIYAAPGSKSDEALNLLASWTATLDGETADADRREKPRHQGRTERFLGAVVSTCE
jgi:hypothetical protein